MCKIDKYFYAVGGYNTMVTNTAVRFDGRKWERTCDITLARSALRLVLLKAWPDPVELLSETSSEANDPNDSLGNSEPLTPQPTSDSCEMTAASNDSAN
ncbi:unnamed protein product [Litomosoides sigmodontis]|uniref:Uncharacterized protein n=1 Tax=Litomosoides sigmodontis TaxID=42156 RepID=A0A3P7M9W7_LITSI|nr:unnamed protein product [Litomosoides sigmodontis]